MGHLSVLLLKGVAVLLLLMRPPRVSSDYYKTAAVRGIVNCKPCEGTLHEASTPITGAVVRLECKDVDNPQTLYATTDKNGYFFLHPLKNVARDEMDECQVFLDSPPKGSLCDRATDFRGGKNGTYLGHTNGFSPQGAGFLLFTVGPFAFEPSICPR